MARTGCAGVIRRAEKGRIDQRLKSMGCNIDQTSILTTKQRQAAVELFRGIDEDKNGFLSQEVSPGRGHD